MNATHMAARIALVAGALHDAGVEPISLYCHHRGQVDVMVAPADYAAVVARLGLTPLADVDDVAVGTWADVPVWCRAYAREAVAS